MAAEDVTNNVIRWVAQENLNAMGPHVFIPWLQASLPPLKARLDAASRNATTETDRLHFADMARQLERLQKIGTS